jgi:predicted nucleotidyltransferase
MQCITIAILPKNAYDTPMNTQPQQLAERIAAIAPHSRIMLFGSRARGSHTAYSDIDIAV